MSHCLFYFVCIFTILSSIFGSDSSYAHAYIHTYTHLRGHKLQKVGIGFIGVARGGHGRAFALTSLTFALPSNLLPI